MGILGRRFDTAAAQSFARTFNPIAWEENERRKEEHKLKMDQLQTDMDAAEALAGTLKDTEAKKQSKDQAISVVAQFGAIARSANSIRKPTMEAFLNRIEASTGKPVSPYLRELMLKAKPEELQQLVQSFQMEAAKDPEFSTEKLTELLGSDQAVMGVVIPKAQGITQEQPAKPGTSDFTPDKGRQERLELIASQKQEFQDEYDRLNELWEKYGVRASEKVQNTYKVSMERVQKKLEALEKIENDITGKQEERRLKIADEKAKEARAPDVERRKKEATQQYDIYLDELESIEKKLAGELPDEDRRNLTRRKNVLEELIERETLTPGSQTEGFSFNQSGPKDVAALREQKEALEKFAVKAMDYEKLLQTNPGSKTFVADTARFINAVEANIKALNPGWKLDFDMVGERSIKSYNPKTQETKVLHLDPDDVDMKMWDEVGLSGLAKASALEKSMAISMAFQMAFMRGQTGKALSDRDLALFMKEIGFAEQNPEIAVAVVRQKVVELKKEFEISWQNRAFGEDGEVLPLPKYNVDFSHFETLQQSYTPGVGETKNKGGEIPKDGEHLQW